MPCLLVKHVYNIGNQPVLHLPMTIMTSKAMSRMSRAAGWPNALQFPTICGCSWQGKLCQNPRPWCSDNLSQLLQKTQESTVLSRSYLAEIHRAWSWNPAFHPFHLGLLDTRRIFNARPFAFRPGYLHPRAQGPSPLKMSSTSDGCLGSNHSLKAGRCPRSDYRGEAAGL